jgi:K+-sensing histidine kinase KdpD
VKVAHQWLKDKGPAGLTARGDSQLLKVALKNLMENALKYTRTMSQPQVEFGMIDQ